MRDLDEALAATLVPRREPEGHKGTFGRLLVVAGSLEYAGAALLAGTAALRSGAGLVSLCLPDSLRPHLAGRIPELITIALPESSPGRLAVTRAARLIADQPHDALLVGPGLHPTGETRRLVERLAGVPGPPMALDAGALGALSAAPGWWDRIRREAVLTPHPGELARLSGAVGSDPEARAEAARSAGLAWRQVVVLKGARTLVAAPDGSLSVAPFVLPGLATAGTGDVLAGIVGGLLAQGLGPLDAACLGVYLHGRAGEHVSERLGDAGLLAGDLLTEIPRVRRHLVSRRERPLASCVGFRWPRTGAEAP